MMKQKKVAVVNDLSGFGRCSLTVALPILSAMGFQVCPLPTVLLSAHTGYASPYIRELNEDTAPYCAHWEQLGLSFDGILTGYWGSRQQTEDFIPFLEKQMEKGAFCLVDPVMGDDGKRYASCSEELVDGMKRLISFAHCTTPNLTEACMLTGENFGEVTALSYERRCERLDAIGEKLLSLGCQTAVITGVEGENGTLENRVYGHDGSFMVATPRITPNYAGTGDVFSAVLGGKLLQGTALPEALRQTASFVLDVTSCTASMGLPKQDGIVFERFLSCLLPTEE